MDAQLYATLNKAWNSTCRVLFGQEIGELSEYEGYLSEYLPKKARRKSHVSGDEVILARNAYPKDARFVSAGELSYNRDYSLGINQIKDIDSIVEALFEKCEYTGNKILGNSAFVESSDIVMDSQYVHNSTDITESQYVCSSFMVRRGSKYCFAAGWSAMAEFLVRLVGSVNAKRVFESHFIGDSADIYFSHSCFGCQNLMFSFGQRNKSYRIGNLQLAKEKYLGLKAKIISEVCERLKKEKSFPSLLELVGKNAPAELPKIGEFAKKEETSMAPIEKGFSTIYGLLFKKTPGSIREYEGWLTRNSIKLREVKTPFGDFTQQPEGFPIFSSFPERRAVGFDESVALGEATRLGESEIQNLGMISKSLQKIGFFTAEWKYGSSYNSISSPVVFHASNVYKTYDATHADNVALCFHALDGKYVYGCFRALESQFSMKCYNSLYLNRCFELDSCDKCSDSYFCHNCEGLADCMFCFNMKGKRFAIGNTDLEKEKYAQVKEALVKQMGEELGKKKELKWDIYNIGAR